MTKSVCYKKPISHENTKQIVAGLVAGTSDLLVCRIVEKF